MYDRFSVYFHNPNHAAALVCAIVPCRLSLFMRYKYDYHADGQIASADYGNGKTEDFLWDGLALIHRGGEQFINEPHVGNAPKKLRFEGKPRAQRSARRARKGPRGNPVVSSKGVSYFNDMLRVREGLTPVNMSQ